MSCKEIDDVAIMIISRSIDEHIVDILDDTVIYHTCMGNMGWVACRLPKSRNMLNCCMPLHITLRMVNVNGAIPV